MAIEYIWSFPSLEVELNQDGLEKVVTTVHWRLGARDGDHFTDVYGSVGLSPPLPSSFTEFDDLTEEDILSWIEPKLEVEQMKTSLETQLNTLKNPTKASFAPPWL